jgi:cell wall assembly regulator SMI1
VRTARDELWLRLQARCEAICPTLPRGGLNPPATLQQIEALEALVGATLPDDLRDAYRHYNGMQRAVLDGSVRALPVLMGRFHWNDLESLARRWTVDRCIEFDSDPATNNDATVVDNGAVLALTSHARRLPVGCTNTSLQAHVDLHPGSSGTQGQLLRSDLECGLPTLLAASFEHAVRLTLDAFDRGDVTWNGWELVSASGKGLPSFTQDFA